MANILRSAKSGSEWTRCELDAYNIKVVSQSKEEFFGTQDLPNPTEQLAGFMSTEAREDAVDRITKRLLFHLDLATYPSLRQEAAVSDFAAQLLKSLGYEGDRIVFQNHFIPLVISGVTSDAQIDVCIMDEDGIFLLLQSGKGLPNKDPEPEVIAGAIAAFYENNQIRERDLKLPSLDSIMFPCITLVGTTPIFYKITVTSSLSDAVRNGAFPTIQTTVLRYIPTLPRRSIEGMRPLSNRVQILQYLEAFKRFLGK